MRCKSSRAISKPSSDQAEESRAAVTGHSWRKRPFSAPAGGLTVPSSSLVARLHSSGLLLVGGAAQGLNTARARRNPTGFVPSGANRGRMNIYGYDPAVVFAVAFVAIVLLAAILTARG